MLEKVMSKFKSPGESLFAAINVTLYNTAVLHSNMFLVTASYQTGKLMHNCTFSTK